jgi:hypothetical protein
VVFAGGDGDSAAAGNGDDGEKLGECERERRACGVVGRENETGFPDISTKFAVVLVGVFVVVVLLVFVCVCCFMLLRRRKAFSFTSSLSLLLPLSVDAPST